MSKPRFEIIGVWGGPINPASTNNTKECHREYTYDVKRAEWCLHNNIKFTDGTMLYLDARQMEFNERKPKNVRVGGYTELINDCVRLDVCTVEETIKQ
jgi:hypothetical protein